jgi:hypothetical protein
MLRRFSGPLVSGHYFKFQNRLYTWIFLACAGGLLGSRSTLVAICDRKK